MNSKTTLTKRKNVLAAMVGLFAAAGGASSAMAQGDEAATAQGRIDEIIVTANKREQKLSDVPISIAVMTGDAIEDAGIHNISDLSYAVPNLSVWEVGPGTQTITIRGVGNIRGSSSLVGMYLDEVPVSSVPTAQIDLQTIDLARVEVLRGPQGTLYGQGSVGGTVRFITNDPSLEGIEGKVGLSLYDTTKGDLSEEFTGIINLPIIDDELSFRVAATYKNKGGWINQPAIGKEDINDNELSNIRIKGLWQASNKLAVRAMSIHHRNSGGGRNIVNLVPVSDSNMEVAVDPTLSPGFEDDYDLYNLTFNYDFDFATLTGVTSYVDIDKTNLNNSQFAIFSFAPTVALGLLVEESTAQAKALSQEIRLNGDSGVLDWTLGFFYRDFEDLRQSSGLTFSLPGGTPSADSRFSESTAFFADVSYALTDRLTIGAGTRYFEDDREFQSAVYTAKDTFDNLSSKGYLSFAVSDETNIYASISEGFRSGGFNGAAGVLAGGDPTFDQETLTSYELGVKAALLNGRLTTEIALFYSEYTDFQSLSFDPLSGGFSILNAGDTEIKGVELSAHWAVTERLSLGLSGNVTDGEFVKINSSPSTQIVGDPLDLVPEYSYSINADYGFNWSDAISGSIRLDYSRQGRNSVVNRLASLAQDVFHSESIGLLNTHIDAQWDSFTVELFAKNLLDEDRLTTATISQVGPQNRPRSIGVNLTYDF